MSFSSEDAASVGMRQAGDRPAPRWVFVGGTGRSGTTITAAALAGTGALTPVPTELRFHVDRDGLLDLANGDTTFERFREKMLGRWFEHRSGLGGTRGVSPYIERDALTAVLDGPLPHDDGPRRLAGALWTGIITAMFGDGRIVEMTPGTMVRADELSRLVDHDAVMVNVVRDGRDVAMSLARMKWGPDDPVVGLHWWAHRIRRADMARRLCSAPLLTVQLEDLLSEAHRDHWASTLAGHVGGIDAADMHRAMGQFRPEKVKSGKWRDTTPPDVQARLDHAYAELWNELRAEGVAGLPAAPTEAD